MKALMLSAAAVAAVLSMSSPALAQTPGAQTLATLPGDRIENAYEASDGALYYTAVFGGKVMKRGADGATSVFFASNGPQGIVETPNGFLVDYHDRTPDFASGKFSMKGLGAHLVVLDKAGKVLKTIDGPDEDAMFNGLALHGAKTAFIADAGGNRIFKIDIETGKLETWLDSAQLAAAGGPAGAPNGLKVHDGWVYFARKDIYRVKIGADGKAQGAPVLAAKTDGTDDFDVGADGVVYASHGMDVLKVTPAGEVSKLVAGECNFCTSARVSRDQKSLYYAGGSIPGMPGMPNVPGFLRKVDLPH